MKNAIVAGIVPLIGAVLCGIVCVLLAGTLGVLTGIEFEDRFAMGVTAAGTFFLILFALASGIGSIALLAVTAWVAYDAYKEDA